MLPRSLVLFLAALILPAVASAEVQTLTATHTYILGDHDSKDDARQRCLLEAKRKILEQAGVYIESASEVKDLQLTNDKIISFAAAVLQVKDTKEDVGFQQGHMTLTLMIKADVDMVEVRKQLAARQVDAGVRVEVTRQNERLKRLEAQLEAIQQQRQEGQVPRRAPASLLIDISGTELQTLHVQADQGNAEAQIELGLRYALENGGVSQDYVQARHWFEKAAAQADAEGQYLLGLLYKEGKGVPQNYETARQWYEQAAAQGYALAQFDLGWQYESGQGVPQNYETARQWYEQAAAQGYALAQSNLGTLYYLGRGAPQDYVKARQWWEKAAAQGDVRAQTKLGIMYYDGMGMPRNNAQAAMWFEKAAAQGEALAQLKLGVMYYNGQSVPQDYAKARQWWEKAAAQDDADAQFNLGLMYLNGMGVRQDNAMARQWFQKAAVQGDALAQGRLGAMYFIGDGVPKDFVKAYMWLNIAAASLKGNLQSSAADFRDKIASLMTTEQLAEAQRLARQCQARQFKGC